MTTLLHNKNHCFQIHFLERTDPEEPTWEEPVLERTDPEPGKITLPTVAKKKRMSATVELSVILRDGTKTSFTQPAGSGDPCVDIKTLQKSLSSLQQESNAFLTKLVEEEKASVTNGNQNNQSVNKTDDDEDEESEDSDEEEKDKEPAKKKQKT